MVWTCNRFSYRFSRGGLAPLQLFLYYISKHSISRILFRPFSCERLFSKQKKSFFFSLSSFHLPSVILDSFSSGRRGFATCICKFRETPRPVAFLTENCILNISITAPGRDIMLYRRGFVIWTSHKKLLGSKLCTQSELKLTNSKFRFTLSVTFHHLLIFGNILYFRYEDILFL